MTSRTRMKGKDVDDVLGGDEMWKHADATDSASLIRGSAECRSRRLQRCVINAITEEHISISCRLGLLMNQ
ncbi:hypothetical protein J3R83DRAFT_5577 [Lanmaoa asiatica]|nr:hypothetical protein J3R83DRAFT_5577 [Lanmaoa asiatica]